VPSLVVAVRDSRGSLIVGAARSALASSALVAEGLTLRDAVLLAFDLGMDRVLFEVDSLDLVRANRQEIQIF